MQGYLAENAISSKEGKAFITRNGQNKNLCRCRDIEATVSKNKSDIRMLGNRWVGHKTTSVQGSGTLTIYHTSSAFKDEFLDYARTGKDTYFSLQVEVEAPSTRFGREVLLLIGCNFDEITMAMLSAEDGVLEQELPFTFEGVELLKKFTVPDEGEI